MYAPLKNFVDVVTTASSYGINSATPDLQMQVLTINRNFPAGKPTVTLGNGSLNVCDQCYTATSISATLQNPDPATYVVTVRFGNSSVFQIDVTIPSPPPPPVGGDGGVPHGMQEFINSGSFIVPPGVTRLMVEVWGAGGGPGANNFCLGGWGGAGAYSRTVLSVTSEAVVTITGWAGRCHWCSWWI
jgi:hypothetical protein